MRCEIDGYTIHYEIDGEGDDTVVILQGWGTTVETYRLLADILSPKYRVVRLNLPGFGDSTEPREPWGVSEYTDFFIRFMMHLQIEKTILIGHSYGGRMIIKLSDREDLPFAVEKIVLIDAAGILPKKTKAQERSVRRYKRLKKIFSWKIVYALFPDMIDDWKNRQGSADYRAASPMMKQCLVKAVNEDLTYLLPKVSQETLLIWGETDTATPLADGQLMEKMMPNAGLAVIKGVGHFSFAEAPGIFRNILSSYLL